MTYVKNRSQKKSGFTLVELMMVIVVVSVLGSTALSQFIDFRRDGRAANVRETLMTMRVALKNQAQNSLLRCGIVAPSTWTSSGGSGFYYNLGANAYNGNDVTFYGGDTTYQLCKASQVTNVNDRIFWNLIENDRALRYNNGALVGTGGTYKALKNSLLATIPAVGQVYPMIFTTTTEINSYGGVCGVVNFYRSGNTYAHWLFNSTTGDIYAGTNTAGVSECNF